MAAFDTVIIVFRIINNYYGNKILLSDLFQFFKNQKANSHSLNKYKINNENDISKNELILKSPINNNYGDDKGKIIFDVKNGQKQRNNPVPSINIRDTPKTSSYRYSKKDFWKFCIYPNCLINKNRELYAIKDEICSIFSVESLLESIKSLGAFHSLRNEFYNQVNKNKIFINNSSRRSRFNDCESKSKIKIGTFFGVMSDK